jgi:HEAT repeat protein
MRPAEPITRRFGPAGAGAVALLGAVVWLALATPPALAQAPGPESFAKPPETPMELWDAIDYLVRTGQADKAVPYLDAFIKANPDDATLLQIRDRYGVGSVLNLEEHPATRSRAAALVQRFNEAAQRRAKDPERIRQFVKALTASSEERQYGIEQLRRSGADAVPYIIEAIGQPGLTPADHARLVASLAQLGSPALPAILAMLDSPNETIAADAAEALGRTRDTRAVPFLTYPAAKQPESVVTEAARRAVARLTGRPWAAQARSPRRVLIDEATRYLTHEVPFDAEPVTLWTWQEGNVAPRSVSKGQAEGYFGLKLARQAVALDASDHEAQAVLIALALQKAAEASGIENFPRQDPTGAYPMALAAGPNVLGDALRLALKHRLPDVGAAAATVLGRVADRDALYIAPSPPHPLVAALSSPDRRTRFAAARALAAMEPRRPFPGSSLVVPTLAQFLRNREAPRAVAIHGDVNRANTVSGTLRALGYDALTAPSGPQGFRLAAESADVEVIFIEPSVLQGPWKTRDLLANLRADARTAGIPIFLHGPLAIRDRIEPILSDFPLVTFVVTPTDPAAFQPTFQRRLEEMGVRPLSPQERTAFAQQATAILAAIALQPGSPFEGDVPTVEPALAAGLSHPPTAPIATAALAEVPDQKAQRSLADTLLDPSRAEPLRLQAAGALTRSLQRFGPLLTDDQERKLLGELDDPSNSPALRAEFAAVVGALRPRPEVVGNRLEAADPASVLPSPHANAAPAPPAPQPQPEAEQPESEPVPPPQP